MTMEEQEKFDLLLEEVIETLPAGVRGLLEEVAIVVEDSPSPELLSELNEEVDEGEEMEEEDLCGLHTGTAFTERSVEADTPLPSEIRLVRAGIVSQAGGWGGRDGVERVRSEIRITLLHEVGHQFGLNEEDLADLGYD